MRRLLGVFLVLLIAGIVVGITNCSGSGGRKSIAPPPGFAGGAYLPLIGGADSGLIDLVLSNGFALYDAESSLGAFDPLTGGGFAFVDGETYFSGLSAFDLNGDGVMDQVSATMRNLPADAINAGYLAGYALVGGADYLPHELSVGNFVFYLPINQNFANASLVLAFWSTASPGVWVPFGFTGSVVPHPNQDRFPGIKVVEVRGYSGYLGPIGVFAPFHTGGGAQG